MAETLARLFSEIDRPVTIASSAGPSSGYRVKAPAPGHAFELVLSSVLELEAGTCDEVHDGARHQDLTGTGAG